MASQLDHNDITLKSAGLIILICILFGANPVAIKLSLTGLGAFTAAGIRFTIAVSAIYAWACIRSIPLKISKRQLGHMMMLSAIFVVQLSCFYNGLSRTTASHGVLISNALPFFILILAHFFIPGDSISLKKSIGITLGFLGVFFLFFDNQDLKADLRQGDIIVLAAVILWSSSAVFVKRIISEYNTFQITIYPMLFALPFFFIGGVLWDGQMIKNVSSLVVKAVLYQSLVTASFGFIAWNSMLRKFGATALHSFIFIMPLAGVIFGVLILGEPVTPYLVLSIFFIISGVMAVNMKFKKR